MTRKLLAALSSAFLALLPACDAIVFEELKPGISTALEVRDRMGTPTMEWQETDGSIVWEYPRMPNGVVNYMVVIGPDKILREIRQVLTEENFARILPGLDKAEVRRLLGKPAEDVFFELKRETVWSWKVSDDGQRQSFFNVHFNGEGKVARTSRNEVATSG
ncbi:MAG: SmpA / OmlA family protein [Betaproteobacteria bacterium ADurb.Bin341]|nr:MAG: SmpA / OmlA family protein [Betaproteobacteria bacterium ADurb.Bin341]